MYTDELKYHNELVLGDVDNIYKRLSTVSSEPFRFKFFRVNTNVCDSHRIPVDFSGLVEHLFIGNQSVVKDYLTGLFSSRDFIAVNDIPLDSDGAHVGPRCSI